MGNLVLAYHGCDVTTRDGLVRGNLSPRISKNPYDWLGDGMYFFEGDPDRALKLATFSHHNPEKLLTKQPIATPAVVGAVLEVERWLDLTTQEGITSFTTAASAVIKAAKTQGTEMPVNGPAFEGDDDDLHRSFDRAACQMVHIFRGLLHKDALTSGETEKIVATAPFQASRGAFEQGKPIAPASAMCADTHIQIAVHDLNCVRGWFMLAGQRLLSDADLLEAQARLTAAKAATTATKPRRRPTV